MHQLKSVEASVVAKETMEATLALAPEGEEDSESGARERNFPPTPSMVMKAMTLGIHAMLSYLLDEK